MSQEIDAIYDDGVLKPLVPLVLPDQTRVKLTVDQEHLVAPDTEAESAVLAKQQAALDELRREIDQLPQHENKDGWSVRQHDEVLYGKP